MLYVDGVKYKLWVPSKEKEFENLVEKNITNIFGEDILYFPLKTKLKSISGIGSIPDGYAIGLTKPYKWYVIEVELSTHPVFEHIVSQLNKFNLGLKDTYSRRNISDAVYKEIDKNPITKAYVKKTIESGELYRFISSLIEKKDPTIVVIIDKKTRKLEDGWSTISIKDKLISEFKVYERADTGLKNAFIVEPLFEDTVKKIPEHITQVPVGSITKQREYNMPLLESLIELGGGGKVHEVMDMVFQKMENQLTEADLSKLESGGIRWKKYVQWARYHLKINGHIKSDSPRGIWEITDKGKKNLQN